MVTALLLTSLLSILGSSNSRGIKGTLLNPPIIKRYPQIGSCAFIKDDLAVFKTATPWYRIYYEVMCVNGKTYHKLCKKLFVKFGEGFKLQYVKVSDHMIMLYKYFRGEFENLNDAMKTIKSDKKNGACFQTYQNVFPDYDSFGKVILYIICACSWKYLRFD